MKSCKSNAFVFCSRTKPHTGQTPQSTLNHCVSLSMLPKLFASEQPLLDFFVIHSVLAVFAFCL